MFQIFFVYGTYCLPRVVLLLHIVVSLHGVFVLEQPIGSEHVFARHHRFEQFTNEVAFAA